MTCGKGIFTTLGSCMNCDERIDASTRSRPFMIVQEKACLGKRSIQLQKRIDAE